MRLSVNIHKPKSYFTNYFTNLNPKLILLYSLDEKKMKIDEFLPIFSQVKKEKEQGCYEDFLECLKLYDKNDNGLMLSAELSHTLMSLGERLDDDECDTVLKDCMDPEDDDGQIPYAREYSKELMKRYLNLCYPRKHI